jgi:hypothetical protein
VLPIHEPAHAGRVMLDAAAGIEVNLAEMRAVVADLDHTLA